MGRLAFKKVSGNWRVAERMAEDQGTSRPPRDDILVSKQRPDWVLRSA